MKNNIIHLAALTTVLIFSCKHDSSKPGEPVHLRTIIDLTDPSTLLPDSIEVLSVFGLQSDRNNRARFGLTGITDKELNPVKDIVLADGKASAGSNNTDDLHYRDKEVSIFYSRVLEVLREVKTPDDSTESLQFSECFKTLCKQLQVLKDDTTIKRKMLWVFSDMMEKSLIYNAYTQPLNTTEEQNMAKQVFTKTNLLPDSLNGITVYFFYNPVKRKDDIRFSSIITVFENLLKERGANVFIQASNKILHNE